MRKRHYSIIWTVIAVAVLLLQAGCESDKQTGALIGTAAGAGIGQAIGRDTTGTLVGAAVGAGAGYLIGAQSDKNKAKEQEAAQQQQAQIQAQQQAQMQQQNTQTVWITNSNGSKTSIVLRKEGDHWYGPKGERYDQMPTEDQLREVYGF